MRVTVQRTTRRGGHQKTHIGPWAIAGVVVVVIVTAKWIAAHAVLSMMLAAVVIAAAIVFWVKLRPALRVRKSGALVATDPHRLDPDEFEHFLADLCRRDGCRNVRVVGGANDHAADVLYTDPHGRRALIQAKRYQRGNSVGNEHVQMVNGTYRDAHGCTHASIVTTPRFTASARQYAQHVGIELVDDARLNAWIGGQRAAAPWN
jgi:restriction system protein